MQASPQCSQRVAEKSSARSDNLGTAAELVKARRVTKRFPDLLALDGARLEIRRTEVNASLGENPRGGSTLIKLLSGFCQPDDGNILVREKVQVTDPLHSQAPNTLASDLFAIEKVFLGSQLRRAVAAWPSSLLDERAMSDPRQLPGGVWRRCGRSPLPRERAWRSEAAFNRDQQGRFRHRARNHGSPTTQLPYDGIATALKRIWKVCAAGVTPVRTV
jgi:energy-coupling factor transporter ATP-binding protein EcfA2